MDDSRPKTPASVSNEEDVEEEVLLDLDSDVVEVESADEPPTDETTRFEQGSTTKIEPDKVEPGATQGSPDVEHVISSVYAFVEAELDGGGHANRRQQSILHYEMGHLDELYHADPQIALTRYERAREVDPSFVPALRALQRLYGAAKRFSDQVSALQAEIEATADKQNRAQLLTVLGDIQWRRLNDVESAVANLQSASALAPKNRRTLEILRAVYAETQQWDDLVGVLRQMANATTDPIERAHLTVEMAEICELRLGNAEEAEELYARALALCPDNQRASVALRRIYLQHARWQRLSEFLARDAMQESEAAEMFADLYWAASIAEVYLHDDTRAVSLLEAAAAMRPTDSLPLQTLVELYQRTGQVEELASALTRQLRNCSDATQRADICYRLAITQRFGLKRPEKALEVLRQGVQDDPNHEPSLRALFGLYEQLSCWEDLLDLELSWAERQHNTRARVDAYVRAGRICEEQLQDLKRAAALYERAWRVDDGSFQAFRALERIYRLQGQWDALATLYETRADHTNDTQLVAVLLRRCARVYEERLAAPQRATAVLEKLRKTQPEDREALTQLARLYEAEGNTAALAKTLDAWATATTDINEQSELRHRIAELKAGPLRHPEAAVDLYREALTKDANDIVARQRLNMLLERMGRWNELVASLTTQIERTENATEAAELSVQAGQLCEDKLGDLDAAHTSYEQAIQHNPQNTIATLALENLLRRQENWEPLIALRVQLAENTKDLSAAAASLCRAAEICEHRMAHPRRALELFVRALELAPDCGAARQGLERVYINQKDFNALESHYVHEIEIAKSDQTKIRNYLQLAALFDRTEHGGNEAASASVYKAVLDVVHDQPDALHALATVYRRAGAWEQLAGLLGRIAANTEDRDAALSALKEWASIVEVHQSDQWDPTPIYERILDGDPRDAHAIAALENHAYVSRDTDAIVRLAMLQIPRVQDSEWIAALCLRAATVLAMAEKYTDAVELLRRALGSSPDYLPAIRLLRRLCEQLEDWQRVADLLSHEADLVGLPATRNIMLAKAGAVYNDHLGQHDLARKALEKVFAADPSHTDAFQRLIILFSGRGSWSALAKLYKKRLEVEEGPERASHQFQLAMVYIERLDEPATATQVLSELLESDPQNRKALETIIDLFMQQQRWREAEEHLGVLIPLLSDEPKAQRNAAVKRADLLAGSLGEEDAALDVLQHVMSKHGGDLDILNRCVRLYRRRGDWNEAAKVLEELSQHGDTASRVSVLVSLAEMARDSLRDADRSRAALAEAAVLCIKTGDGLDTLRKYFDDTHDAEGFALVLAQALSAVPQELAEGAVAARLSRANTFWLQLSRTEQAEQEIREALRIDPNAVAAYLELGQLSLSAERADAAASAYEKAVAIDPFCADAYRGMASVAVAYGDQQRANLAAQAIVAVGTADTEETKRAQHGTESFERLLHRGELSPLGVHDYWRLLAPVDEAPAGRDLLWILADYLPQLGLPELELAASRPLVPLDDNDPLVLRCDVLARVLGAHSFQYALAPHVEKLVQIRPTAPLVLVIDEAFAADATDATFRFVVGRTMAKILTRSIFFEIVPEETLVLILAAVVELFQKGFGDYLMREDALTEMNRRISRVLSRKDRRQIEPNVLAYAAEGPLQADRLTRAASVAAERAGLLLCASIPVAHEVLTTEKAHIDRRADLLRFATSAQYATARRRLGVL